MALYDDIIVIARNYLGLAAEEYMERRCRVSLNIQPGDLKPEHIERLAGGIEMTAEAYMGKEKAKKFKDEIMKLKK